MKTRFKVEENRKRKECMDMTLMTAETLVKVGVTPKDINEPTELLGIGAFSSK